MSDPIRYRLAELETATGVTARTIRYYISEGLLPPLISVGRTASYGEEHRKALEQIVAMKATGASIEEIRRRLGERPGDAHRTRSLESATWNVFGIAEDTVVHVRAGLSPWRMRAITQAMAVFRDAINEDSDAGERNP